MIVVKKIKEIFHQIANKLIKVNVILKKFEIILVLIGLLLAYYAFKDAREQLNISILSNSWDTISRKAIGNSGKKEALQTLFKKGISLSNIDISTKTHGGKWDELPKTKIGEKEFIHYFNVEQRVYLERLDLSKKIFGYKANLEYANFSGSALRSANFEGAYLKNANFSGADLILTSFSGADLTNANFSGADLTWANFEGADLQKANFEGAELRGAKFENAENIEYADFGKWNLIYLDEDNPIDALLPFFSKAYNFKIFILTRGGDENNPESWQEYKLEDINKYWNSEEYEHSYDFLDNVQFFSDQENKTGKTKLTTDMDSWLLKIKILNNDKVKKAFEARKIKPKTK